MTTVTLRIDVPDSMTAEEVCDMLDGIKAHIEGPCLGALDEAPRASDADWMDEDSGDIHYWNP